MSDLTIGIAGATGALGAELIKVLDTAPWRPDTLVPLASPGTTIPFVEYGEAQVAVDDLRDQALEALDGLFLAVPPDVARGVANQAAMLGIPVVDCSGALSEDEDVPLAVPWINPEALQQRPERGILSIPHPAASLIAAALGPLVRAGLAQRAQATVLLPASVWGRGGMEELSKQVISLFNSGTPPRKVFEHGLAFDLIPQTGTIGPEGWTASEQQVREQVAVLTGADVVVSLVGVPVFSGVSASIVVQPARPILTDLVRQVLKDGGVRITEASSAREVPRPRNVDGEPFVHGGRVRLDPHGQVHLWASMDNLRASAATAVACGAMLFRRE